MQAETITSFGDVYPLGLSGFHGCGYAGVDEGFGIISEDRISTHTQTEYFYDIR